MVAREGIEGVLISSDTFSVSIILTDDDALTVGAYP